LCVDEDDSMMEHDMDGWSSKRATFSGGGGLKAWIWWREDLESGPIFFCPQQVWLSQGECLLRGGGLLYLHRYEVERNYCNGLGVPNT